MKAIACDDLNNCNTSSVESETYTKDNTAPTFTFSDNAVAEATSLTMSVTSPSDGG